MTRETSRWRRELADWVTKSASDLDDFVDVRWEKLKKRQGWGGLPQIQPYIGYANASHVWLHGRVLTNPVVEGPREDDQWWDNLADTFRRYASNEVPGVEIEALLGSTTHRTTSDAEGYFFIEAEHELPAPKQGMWSTAGLRIANSQAVGAEESTVLAKISTPPSSAQFGVISDVDDTILHTGATSLLTMAKLTFFGNARSRLPLPGVNALYRALQQGASAQEGEVDPVPDQPFQTKPTKTDHRVADERPELNPIFYVSSSPWNLFDMLEDFLEVNAIPPGPILLRDLGFDENKFLKEGHGHKLEKTKRVLAAYPELPFVLVGDSGQEDAHLYSSAAEEFGSRIKAIFIRDVDPLLASSHDELVQPSIEKAKRHGVPMHLIEDSNKAAAIAVDLGLIDGSALPAISEAVTKDEERWTSMAS